MGIQKNVVAYSDVEKASLEVQGVSLSPIDSWIPHGIAFNEDVAVIVSSSGAAAMVRLEVCPGDVYAFADAAFHEDIPNRNIMTFAQIRTSRIVRYRCVKLDSGPQGRDVMRPDIL